MTWRTSLAPLGERDFRWYFASRSTNLLGSMMAGIAITFAVLALTDSAGSLGQVLAARTIPMVLFLLFGGVLADRFPRRLVLQLSNVLSALTQGAVAYLVITGHATLPAIIVLEAVNGTVSAVGFPAMAGMVPQLVPREQLQSANALLSLIRGAVTIVGPTVGALLVVTVGAGWALAADAVSWALAAALMIPIRSPDRVTGEKEPGALGELREGWRLFSSTTWLWVVVLAFAVLNAIWSGAWLTLGPAEALSTIGARGWGLALSAESLGMVVTTIVLLRLNLRRPLLSGMLGCSVMALPMIVLGVEPTLVAILVVTFLAGAGSGLFSIGWSVAMQENIDEKLLSRAYSYDALGSWVAMPVGQLVYGPLGDAFGYRDVLLLSGIGYGVVALSALASRSVRTLGRVPVTVEPSAAAA